MPAKSKRSDRSKERMLWIMIGIALAISAIGIVNFASASYAHSATGGMMSGSNDMMFGSVMPMHSMMNEQENIMDSSMTNCMSMMEQHEMTQEEIDEMLKSMDRDGNGQCDYCGMPVEMCRKMMG